MLYTPPIDQASTRRANVIWILADQHRGQALGYRGDANAATPNIDNLARNGMRFDQAVAGAPWCCPFRGALLTGKYPHQNGVTQTPAALDPETPTLVGPLRQAGYHTAWVGKWHLDGSNSPFHRVPPSHRGAFDYWMGYENNNNQEETFVYGTDSETPQRLAGYETDVLTDLFIDHLRAHVTSMDNQGEDYQPFFAALSVQPPHSPYVPPLDTDGGRRFYHNPTAVQLRPNVPRGGWAEAKARLDLAGYYGMIENLDANIGRLRAALRELGIDRETYLVFFSDHGDCLGSHGQWEKSSPWEEAIRIPFVISTVGGRDHMRVGQSSAVLNHVDIAPTTLGLCGIPVPASMVGFDYSPLCIREDRREYQAERSPATAPDSAFLQQIPRKFHPHSVNQAWRGVVMEDGWKYVCMPGRDWLLFDTREDPYEMANLCFDTVYQEEKERCHARLKQWIVSTGDCFDLPDIALP